MNGFWSQIAINYTTFSVPLREVQGALVKEAILEVDRVIVSSQTFDQIFILALWPIQVCCVLTGNALFTVLRFFYGMQPQRRRNTFFSTSIGHSEKALMKELKVGPVVGFT